MQPIRKVSPPCTRQDLSALAATIVDLLTYRANVQSHENAYTFLIDGETEAVSHTYRSLDIRARAIAAKLQSLNLKQERAVLLFPSGLEYLEAFFGCLYAGVIAIPAYPPRRNRSMERIESILKDSNARVILTDQYTFPGIDKFLIKGFEEIKCIITPEIDDSLSLTWLEPEISAKSIAFLQYTSGSTSVPKGVVVSHENLINNQRIIKNACSHSDKTVFVGWLPLYHDMGLIGNVLQPLFLGIHCVLMAPISFLQKPVRWLQAISRYRGTTSGGPNFAYELCVSKITKSEVQDLDLSCWDIAYNGSEPINEQTLKRFSNAFAGIGFKKDSFYPCYGMAEATLFVSGKAKGTRNKSIVVDSNELETNGKILLANKTSKNSKAVVSCGHTWLDMKVAIVDPEKETRCSDNEVGEVWISGISVAGGYWEREERNRQTFNKTIKGLEGTYFLRSGDLGFIREDELYITGRIKDVIIIRGRNLYPQDIEISVSKCHHAFKSNSAAAFSVEINGVEELILLQEVSSSFKKDCDVHQVSSLIREMIIKNHEVNPHAIILVDPLSIPKTSSGKIQRYLCKEHFLSGKLASTSQ
jgi:acyl-CoA synthetase (AMP-forming)/AMP-acid ligase II